MNYTELMEQIGNQEWTVEVKLGLGDGSTITMGRYGIIVIIFNEDGSITFPSHLDFLPLEYDHWKFDEEKQEINFMNPEGQISSVIGLPQKFGTRLIMYDHDQGKQKRRFVAYPSLQEKIRQQKLPHAEINEGNIIFAHDYVDSPIKAMVEREELAIHRLKNSPSEIEGLREVFNYLIENSDLKNIMVTTNNNLEKDPFEESINFKMAVERTPFTLVASRSLMIEVVGKLLIEYNHQIFKSKRFSQKQYQFSVFEIIMKYFADRIVLKEQ
ncbi:hypothetical protein FEZ51_04065 [Pediococcus stilesii]|uniref:Uncharacterized protein n=1 Tax=Pediococcus stilesii TaxID=331679 RepID=A0A5R9BXP9_9LACO|nr:hypothetical protein [Pediococcus stilesii]TLQ04820.1 hypothetical protein FEZ51_04065 [Pediococcus stilesii]